MWTNWQISLWVGAEIEEVARMPTLLKAWNCSVSHALFSHGHFSMADYPGAIPNHTLGRGFLFEWWWILMISNPGGDLLRWGYSQIAVVHVKYDYFCWRLGSWKTPREDSILPIWVMKAARFLCFCSCCTCIRAKTWRYIMISSHYNPRFMLNPKMNSKNEYPTWIDTDSTILRYILSVFQIHNSP